jgi:sporulation protein YlmC with PRC-barrel domain
VFEEIPVKTAESLIAAMALALCITAHADSPAALDKKANDAHALVGKPVRTEKGERLGKVNDVIVDEAQGKSYAVISYGQNRFAAIPLDRVRSVMKNDTVVLDRSELEKARMSSAPAPAAR